jgi:ADP-ribosylglycohydrolase
MSTQEERLERARVSLEGLSVGDAFGQTFFLFAQPEVVEELIADRMLERPPWRFTDDTMMALSVLSILRQHGHVQQAALARSFAERYDTARGYGPAMHDLLREIRAGGDWQEKAAAQFEGQGSYGNGAAMRVAPLGAFFTDDLPRVAEEAERSAVVTHTHAEGIAGAIAVAVATAYAWQVRSLPQRPSRAEFLDLVLPWVPDSEVRGKIRKARDMLDSASVPFAVAVLGNGNKVSAQDTVPFALWCAASHLDNYEEALWLTVSALGDRDTTCAIVGGIVAAFTGEEGIPRDWRQAREPLPAWPFEEMAL